MPDYVESTVHMPDGRQLHVVRAGNLDGVPVVVHHGSPGGPVLDPAWVLDAHDRELSLVTYARPGYGRSARAPGRSVADAAYDVGAVADALGIGRFLTVGLSGGGMHALACAALLPQRVVAAVSVASPAPHGAEDLDFLAGMGEGNIEEHRVARAEGEQGLRALFEAEARTLTTATARSFADAMTGYISDVDAAVLQGPLTDTLLRQYREGLRSGVDGWVDDALLFYVRPWGFDVADIRVPVLVMQGRHDDMVPFGHGKWLAGHVPGAEARLMEADGHLTLWNQMPEIHAWLLSQWHGAAG